MLPRNFSGSIKIIYGSKRCARGEYPYAEYISDDHMPPHNVEILNNYRIRILTMIEYVLKNNNKMC